MPSRLEHGLHKLFSTRKISFNRTSNKQEAWGAGTTIVWRVGSHLLYTETLSNHRYRIFRRYIECVTHHMMDPCNYLNIYLQNKEVVIISEGFQYLHHSQLGKNYSFSSHTTTPMPNKKMHIMSRKNGILWASRVNQNDNELDSRHCVSVPDK